MEAHVVPIENLEARFSEVLDLVVSGPSRLPRWEKRIVSITNLLTKTMRFEVWYAPSPNYRSFDTLEEAVAYYNTL